MVVGFSVRVYSDSNAMALAVADRVCALSDKRQSEQQPLVLGLAAGESPQGIYRALERRVHSGRLDLTRCLAFCLDEYYPIEPQDPRSYARQMSAVAAKLGICEDRLCIPAGAIPREEIELHCKRYEEAIRLAGGIDLQLLGVGRSGHLGFNEPHATRQSRTRLVQLDERTRQDAASSFGGLGRTPREAITMGIETILEAKEIALIVCGGHKAEVIRHLVAEPPSSAIPASFLQTHPHATVHVDEDAAKLLGGTAVGREGPVRSC